MSKDVSEIAASCFLIFIIIAIIFSVIVLPFIFGNITYSNGTRVGVLNKFSERGLFVKNWCGQLAMGGYTSDDKGNLSLNVIDFGIDRRIPNNPMIKKINDLLGKRVEVTYEQKAFGGNMFIGCSDYIVKDIKEVK